MDTYYRVSSYVVGSEEAKECGVGGGASTLPFTDCPCGGRPSNLEAGEGGDSPAFGSKEGVVAILSLGYESGPSSLKERGEVDGGGDLDLQVGAGGDSPAF